MQVAIPERASTQLPPVPQRRHRRDWGAVAAKVFCVLFALVGVMPLGVGLVVRSAWARAWAARETKHALEQQGVNATFEMALRLWPVSLELTNLRVDSSDGGAPAVTSPRASVRPRFFALLSGKLAIDQIEIDAPHVRLVVHDGKVANLDVKLPEKKGGGGPFHAPFRVLSVADAALDLDVEGVKATVDEADVDVTADDDPERGSSFELALHLGRAVSQRAHEMHHMPGEPDEAVDEDTLCSVEGRLRIEPDTILVRRLTGAGSADLDAAPGTRPRCELPEGDKHVVSVELSHLRVRLPKDKEPVRIDGHVKARAPLGLAERAVHMPEVDGWVGVDMDVRYAEDTEIPELSGHFEAHDIMLDRYRFAQEIQSDLRVQRNLVTSPHTVLRIADGAAVFTDVTVEPLAKGIPVRMKLDITGVSFTSLMRDLGVSAHPHVAWDLRELHAAQISGTGWPLHLDGDFQSATGAFEVDDSPYDSPAHKRILGFREATMRAHVAIRASALQFSAVNAKVGKSTVENGFCSIGFHEDLKVDVPAAHIDLSDISPLAAIPLAGQSDVEVHVDGHFTDPKLEADASIQSFVFGDMPLGDVKAAHATLSGLVVDLKNVKAQKGKSPYEMPSARLDFGGKAGMEMDAQIESSGLGMRDFFSVFKLDDDPRFADIDGTLVPRATLHIALGGPEDACGDGFFDVRATAHATDVKLYGETFDDGDVDLDYRWKDRLAGLAGADIDIRALTLHKVHPANGQALGALLGSGTIARGGQVTGSVVLQAIPMSRVQSLGSLGREIEGTVSGMLQVDGTLDAYTVRGDVDATPLRMRGAQLGPSHLRVVMTQDAPTPKPIGKTHCGGAIPAPSEKASLEADVPQGSFALDGELFGGEAVLDHVTITRQRSARVAGKIALRKLDVGALALLATPPKAEEDEDQEESSDAGAPAPVTGQISGDLTIHRLTVDDLPHASLVFAPASFEVSRGGDVLSLRPTQGVVTVESDQLSLPPLVIDFTSPRGLKGTCTVKGGVKKITSDAELALSAELEPIDLGVLVGLVPKLERSQGTLSGKVAASGKWKDPRIAGEVHVKGGEFAVHGLPSVISDVDVDAVADADELRITHGTAKFAGGTLAVSGSMPLAGLALNQGEALIAARDIRLTPAQGIGATFDADLVVSLGRAGAGSPNAALPHVAGDVTITSFDYTRPMNLEANALGVHAKRMDVETYDPSLDSIVLDGVRVHAKAPLRIRNNLVEAQLVINSGALTVTGTDQRVGLRGELRALPGGRFHFRANDFEVRQALIRFDDPTRIAPNVDVLATTEYRRYSDTSAGAAAGAGAAGATSRGGIWRITMHAFGDADNLKLDMTSDPALSQEDIVLLLTIGMTRAEVDQLQAGSLGASAALEALATVSGAGQAVKTAIPVIDDFRFGSAYSTVTGRTEPQVIVGKRLTDNLRANVATTVAEDRELRSNIEWRLNRRVSVLGSYDNINDVSSSAVGNVGVDFRWRLEFE